MIAGTKMKWWQHTNWCGDAPWWECGEYEGWKFESKVLLLQYFPVPESSNLGYVWDQYFYQALTRWQPWGLYDTTFHWDYAYVEWCWLEYYPTGELRADLIMIGDEDHSFKQLQTLTVNATLPAGTGVALYYKALTPLGWTPHWIPAGNGSALNVLTQAVQLRLVLERNATSGQTTPLVHGVTLNYGDPPPSSVPIIQNVNQTPQMGEVGYLDWVNVSAVIETYAPLSQVLLTYTTTNWTTATVIPMNDSYNIGTSTFHGMIPPFPKDTTMRYRIYAENAWGNETLNMTSEEYSYTIIDNVPPNILHTNSSIWVTPVSPLPSVESVLIECQVTDISDLIDVKMNVTIPGTIYDNYTVEMELNESSSRYYRRFSISPTMQIVYYNIRAYDDVGNLNITRCYTLSIDRQGPTIQSWTNPPSPEYKHSVYILADISDPNGVVAVALRWTADNWVHSHTREMNNTGGDRWETVVPIPPYAYLTTIQWEIEAKDSGDNVRMASFQYQVLDRTPPEILDISFPKPVAVGRALPITITVYEPASGVDTSYSYLTYKLASDPLVHHVIFLENLSEGVWQAVIPGLLFNETAIFWVRMTDKAGYSVTSQDYSYTVVERVSLVNWEHFLYWVLIAVAVTGILLVYRRHGTRIKGNAFTGLGAVGLVAVTAVIWSSPLSWLTLGNLSFQEWLNQLGESGEWFALILLFFAMFLVLALSLGTLYSYDRRRGVRGIRRIEMAEAMGQVMHCLDELEET